MPVTAYWPVAAIVSGVLATSVTTVPSPAAAGPARAGTSAAACDGWQTVTSPSAGPSGLAAVAATSAHGAWAVGTRGPSGRFRTLTEHWDGHAWKIVASPNPAAGASPTDALTGVAATSATNAWAAGFYEKTTTSFRTLAEHWDGTRWTVVPSPNSGVGENAFTAVSAAAAGDIWAVGFRQDRGSRRTLTEHWDGHAWKIVPSPNVGTGDNFLFGVAAVSATRAWAVGSDSKSFGQTLVLRWNGSRWSVVPSRNPGQGDRFLLAVAAPTAGSALAVGSDLNGNQTRAQAQRWTGTAWSLTAAQSPAQDYNALQAVAATGDGNAWAVGARRASPGAAFRPLAEHWNGRAWTAAAAPSPGQASAQLFGAAAVPGGHGFWAVGAAGSATLTEFHC
jgi:hypothetical protein